MTSRPAAFTGLLFLLPIFILNSIAGARIQPFYSWFELSLDRLGANPVGLVALGSALALLLVGSLINLPRGIDTKPNGGRRVQVANIFVGIVSFLILFLFVGAFANEYYWCEVRGTPNCD